MEAPFPSCDLIKSEKATQCREETPTLTAGQRPQARSVVPGMAATWTRQVLAREAPPLGLGACEPAQPATWPWLLSPGNLCLRMTHLLSAL